MTDTMTTSRPVYRIDSEYAADAGAADAVAALRGTHDDYHRPATVYVLLTYAADLTIPPAFPGRQEVHHKAGEPIFGYRVTVYGLDLSFGAPSPARVSFGSHTGDAEETAAQAELIHHGIALAQAANREPCARCAADHAGYQARRAAQAAVEEDE